MEEQKDMLEMIEMMTEPSFCVKEGHIILLNRAARQLLIEPGTPIAELLPPDSQEYSQFQGGCLHLNMTVSDQCYSASVRRINDCDIFRLEQDADQLQLRTMALVAMGMRMPLSDVMTTAEQLFSTLEQLDDPVTRAKVAQINRGLNQLHRLACNMSAAAQYTSDTAPRMSCRDICAVLEEIFDHAQTLINQSGITLQYTGPKEPILCLINEERLERAVYNIISNSLKFTPKGGCIDAKLTRRGKKLYLSVRDNGTGIPDSMIGSIHNCYQRQPGVEDSRHGLGLGMLLLRTAASAHGGTVLIDHPEGGGTRITMTIAIRTERGYNLRSDVLSVDYAGERDHALVELSDILPPELYAP